MRYEETVTDHRFDRFMIHNLADDYVPANADVCSIDVIFVDEQDDEINPLGVKGVGEIGIAGTAAAMANAVYHATNKRVRDLPITIDTDAGVMGADWSHKPSDRYSISRAIGAQRVWASPLNFVARSRPSSATDSQNCSPFAQRAKVRTTPVASVKSIS